MGVGLPHNKHNSEEGCMCVTKKSAQLEYSILPQTVISRWSVDCSRLHWIPLSLVDVHAKPKHTKACSAWPSKLKPPPPLRNDARSVNTTATGQLSWNKEQRLSMMILCVIWRSAKSMLEPRMLSKRNLPNKNITLVETPGSRSWKNLLEHVHDFHFSGLFDIC